jgi:hypothetical protein
MMTSARIPSIHKTLRTQGHFDQNQGLDRMAMDTAMTLPEKCKQKGQHPTYDGDERRFITPTNPIHIECLGR